MSASATGTGTRTLPVGEVAAGDELPELTVPVTARTVVMGASASRDWQPQHHDQDWARERVGSDIFLNTPTQAGWIERYLTDWAGPAARLGKLRFRMRDTVEVGDELVFRGEVAAVTRDGTGAGWVDVDVELRVDGAAATECTARLALPAGPDDNPWARHGDEWRPDAPDRSESV